MTGKGSQRYAGIDLGGTFLKYGVIDREGRVIHHGTSGSPQDIDALADLLAGIWNGMAADHGPILGTGFGIPGLFSGTRQRVVQSPHCKMLEGLDLSSVLAPLIKSPLVFDNEANLAAYGEYRTGAGTGAHSMVLLTVGSGIGTGIILGGRIWRGSCGFAGELAHVSLDPSGRPCHCGGRGCLETEVSGPRIVEHYLNLSRDETAADARDVLRLARAGDTAAVEAVRRAGHHLGIGIALAVNLLNPESILLGGGVLEGAGDLILKPAREAARRHSQKAVFDCCSIRPAALGNRAGFIGAALYARDHPGA